MTAPDFSHPLAEEEERFMRDLRSSMLSLEPLKDGRAVVASFLHERDSRIWEEAAKVCDEMAAVKEIVCPEECAAALRAKKGKP